MVRASIKNAEINNKRDLNDEEVLEILAREVKQRRMLCLSMKSQSSRYG